MSAHKLWAFHRRWAFAAAIVVAQAAPAPAQVNASEPDPAVWLRQVYDFYHRSEKETDPGKQADYSVIEKRASKSLAALFKLNHVCEKHSTVICALDWDFVVDGQFVELTDVKVGAAVFSGERATVTASFRNGGKPCVNVYRFVREGGQWKVDDIETKVGRDTPIAIATLLRDFDYNQ